ncbi:MAG: phenylacetate--CoA ligase family protein [Clostridia bacterium]
MDIVKPPIENILYPIMEKKKGNRIRYYIKELKCSQTLSQKRLHDIQKEKLKKLLLECIENVPAYQSFSYLKSDIETDAFSALSKFPILDKKTFRKNPDIYLNRLASKSDLISNCTGGSTSEPVKFFIDRRTVEYYEAARWRGLSWWGISPGTRSVMIWGDPYELNQNQKREHRFKEKWFKNRIAIPAYSLNPESMKEYFKIIAGFRPKYFYGYSSALYAFASLMFQQELTLPFKPSVVVSTAEVLHDYQRELIEKAFGCSVVNEYGAKDAGILAYECKSGNMHISSENVMLEVLDAKTLQPLSHGQSGILLITDLNNFSMPRLRYRLGDSAILSKNICICGKGLPVIEKIDGREDDMFVTVDGVLVHGHAFNHVSRSLNVIQKFQIIQNSPSQAELSIIPNDDSGKDDIDKFIDGVQKLLPKTHIDIKIVKDIPVSSSGKFRYAIRKFSI